MEGSTVSQLSILGPSLLLFLLEQNYLIFPELNVAFSYLILQFCLSCPSLLPNMSNSFINKNGPEVMFI